VVESRAGLGEQCRLADRLPDCDAGIAAKAKAAAIYTNRRFSDHAPLLIDYDFDLG
jgi:hypothetical protein